MANNEDEGRFDFVVDFEDAYEIQAKAMCILFDGASVRLSRMKVSCVESACIELIGVYI